MKLIKYIGASILTLFAIVSCNEKFLEVAPTGSIVREKLATKAGIEGSLVATYSILTGRLYDAFTGSNNWFWGSVLGGDANKGTGAGDAAPFNEIQEYATLSTNSLLVLKYNATYEGIIRANTTLALLAKATEPIADADKKRIAAEARFLRGHYYFEMKKIFNNTPYADENTIGLVVKNNVDLWPKIEADFQFAYERLPEKQRDSGRANKWAAGAYLAKAYLFQKKYAPAKLLFDEVIAKGTTSGGQKYDLMEKYGDLFRAATSDNNKESVFEIQFAVGTGSAANANNDFLSYPYNGGPAGCCGFNQPSFDLVNSFRTDAAGLPLLDGSYNNPENAVKNDMGIAAETPFTPDTGNLDARLDYSVGRRGIPYWDWGNHPGVPWIRDQLYAGPYAPKKFVFAKADAVDNSTWHPLPGNNFPIIRFADVLLMAAEAEVEVGALDKAREYVNRVRARAQNAKDFVKMDDGAWAAKYVIGLYNNTWADRQAVAREAVRFERKLELSGEGHRFFDLVRWGTAKQALDAYIANEVKKLPVAFGNARFTPGKSEYQPIPQSEIDLVGAENLAQNPGY
ncbi:MAG: RagB/SusD family nutrient uptake outer membrane protein [Candidatus Nephrothrix sp. EaCA]|nr:MAG: RagB/SusD family nutrient uptake outer membrane protein [Candidatus Nephrothrix sp. EaCA]